jgi:hypothetical protein
LSAKANALENQLTKTQELLMSRNEQLEARKSEVNALTRRLTEMESAKDRAEKLMRDELKKKDEMLQSKDSIIKKLEQPSSAKAPASKTQPSQNNKMDPFELLIAKNE